MENLFEQFTGADLDRLVECIKAIRKSGLTIDKYTQAGVNRNNGNVWVWSDDWVGCVYCSIGFDVQWSWSCPYCGEEYDFDIYQEMEQFADDQREQFDDHCHQCKE